MGWPGSYVYRYVASRYPGMANTHCIYAFASHRLLLSVHQDMFLSRHRASRAPLEIRPWDGEHTRRADTKRRRMGIACRSVIQLRPPAQHHTRSKALSYWDWRICPGGPETTCLSVSPLKRCSSRYLDAASDLGVRAPSSLHSGHGAYMTSDNRFNLGLETGFRRRASCRGQLLVTIGQSLDRIACVGVGRSGGHNAGFI